MKFIRKKGYVQFIRRNADGSILKLKKFHFDSYMNKLERSIVEWNCIENAIGFLESLGEDCRVKRRMYMYL